MTPLEVRDSLITQFNASWATKTDVAWPNRPFDVDVQTEFARFSVQMGTSFEGEKTDVGIGWRIGVVYVDVFVPVEQGDRRALHLATQAEAIFRRKSFQHNSGFGIVTGEPTTIEFGVDPNVAMFHVQVNIGFNAIIE